MSILLSATPGTTFQHCNLPGGVASSSAGGWLVVPDMPTALAMVAAGTAQFVDQCPACTTANRPTTALVVGMNLFDTTLNKPIWLKNTTPTWVDATGSSV